MARKRINVGEYVEATIGDNAPLEFICQHIKCAGDDELVTSDNCPHIVEAINRRLELPTIQVAVENWKSTTSPGVPVAVLILENPHVWVPVAIEDSNTFKGIYDVKFPIHTLGLRRPVEEPAKMARGAGPGDYTHICHIGPGDGIRAIRSVLFDVFSWQYMEHGLRDSLRCADSRHGVDQQQRVGMKMRSSKEAAGLEMLRQYLTQQCSVCASTKKKVDMNAAIPKLGR